jgi:hypothetical protein
MAAALDHIGRTGLGQIGQILRPQAKHAVGMTGSGPDFIEAPQVLVEQGHRGIQVRHGGHAANREARVGLDEIGIGATDLAHQGCDFFSSTRRSPEVTTSTATPSSLRLKITLLAI